MSAVRESDVAKKLAEFINVWPLYSPFDLELASPSYYPPNLPSTILRDCPVCDATPTWVQRDPSSVGIGSVIVHECTHCEKERVWVWFSRDDDHARGSDGGYAGTVRSVFRKLGQWPAQRTEPDRELAKAFSEPLLDLFRKGLTSLSHGCGLGALAYYRRVVEDASSQLVDLFADRSEAIGDGGAARAIRAAKDGRHLEDRLKVAAHALPATLRPGGVNPLMVLYSHYSRGIHGLDDNECLVVAQQLRFAMEYIFSNWRKQMQDAAEFRRTIQKWSDPTKSHERGG